MKTLIPMAMAALTAAVFSASAETRSVTVPVGGAHTEDLGFVPTGYRTISGNGLVEISILPGSTTAIITAGGSTGKTLVEFPDSTGGESALLDIAVEEDLDSTLRSLRRDLADFSGLSLSRGSKTVRIAGTIGTPSQWSMFERILGLPEYAGKVQNLVEFRVSNSTIGKLREELKSNGVDLAEPGISPEPGQFSLAYEENVLRISGVAWSAADVDRIVSVLKSKPWIHFGDEDPGAVGARAIVDVSVDDALLELGVAFVMVSKEASREFGSDVGLAVSGAWSGFYDFLSGRHRSAEEFRIDAGLQSTLTMLAKNKVSRECETGTLRFHNGSTNNVLDLGGTLDVTPRASGDGAAPEKQPYHYGFKIVNKNTHRLSRDTAEIDLAIEMNGVPKSLSEPGAVVFEQSKRTLEPMVRIALGKTVAVAGYDKLAEATLLPSGTPFLRHIPPFSWFVSKEGEAKEEKAFTILLSLRVVGDDEAPMVENTPMPDVSYDANRSNRERIDEDREKNAKYHGFWSWLNWFTW